MGLIGLILNGSDISEYPCEEGGCGAPAYDVNYSGGPFDTGGHYYPVCADHFRLFF